MDESGAGTARALPAPAAAGTLVCMDSIDSALQDFQATEDLLEKALKLAGLVTGVFREAGWELVVVGGSAVEFYTEGAYMSGDIDLCRLNPQPVPLRRAQDLMGRLKATGGPRSWLVGGLYVDLLGLLENEARTELRRIDTPCGTISVIPVEQVLVERVLSAFYPASGSEARDAAKKLLAVCLAGQTPVDWDEVDRLAALPSVGVAQQPTSRPRWNVSSTEPIQVSWEWQEWLASREARREAAARVGPDVVRRAGSSSDRRLGRLFEGERGPAFRNGAGSAAPKKSFTRNPYSTCTKSVAAQDRCRLR